MGSRIVDELRQGIEGSDTLDDLDCYWQAEANSEGGALPGYQPDPEDSGHLLGPIHHGSVHDIPDDIGFRTTHVIAYTKTRIYIRCEYDGGNWIAGVARNPDCIDHIRIYGG